MEYLKWNEKKISDFSHDSLAAFYSSGFVFTRIDRGVMHQTRSARIDLKQFELSSENRRIMKKTDGLELTSRTLPIPEAEYDWNIAKLGKDFYETKFGPGIFSAQKIKEILTSADSSNFNKLLVYSFNKKIIGYAICFEAAGKESGFMHYSYPFYDLTVTDANGAPMKDLGLGMMLRAIIDSQSRGLRYIYIGSLQRPADSYKLQFSGLEWFDKTTWNKDAEQAKAILTETHER